jgi:phospholipid/cholesterol/gamma-HCH transport system substrate-binding protein
MNDLNMRFRVGVFVLAALILLAVLTILFSSFPTLLTSHNQYTVVLPGAPGVGPGTPVRRFGVRIGEVKSLVLDDANGQVDVTILVEKAHTLSKDDRPILVRGLLGGDTSIDFVPKPKPGQPPDRTPVEPGATISGEVGPDTMAILGRTAEMMPTMDETIREYRDLARATREAIPDLRRTNEEFQVTAKTWGKLGERTDILLQTNQDKLIKALDNFNDTVNRVARVFNDDNQKNLEAILKNVRSGSEALDSVAKNTEELIKESQKTVTRVNQSVTRADDVLANLQQATKPMAERSGSVMKNLDESTEKLNRTLAEARELIRAINHSDGSLYRFINDPAIFNNLSDSTCMLTRILPRLDRILHDFEVFSDKIARHPESLGLRGVVDPSSGLKESPTAPSQWRHP